MKNTTTATVSRRSVLKAAAWGTPAIALAVAAPALAASNEPGLIPPRLEAIWSNTTANGDSLSKDISGNARWRTDGDWSETYNPLITCVFTVSINGVTIKTYSELLYKYDSSEVVEFDTKEFTEAGDLVIETGETYDVIFSLTATDDEGRRLPVKGSNGESDQSIVVVQVTIAH